MVFPCCHIVLSVVCRTLLSFFSLAFSFSGGGKQQWIVKDTNDRLLHYLSTDSVLDVLQSCLCILIHLMLMRVL